MLTGEKGWTYAKPETDVLWPTDGGVGVHVVRQLELCLDLLALLLQRRQTNHTQPIDVRWDIVTVKH